MNATKHGERSAQSRAAWRELNAVLRSVNQYDRQVERGLEGAEYPHPELPADVWVDRVVEELRLSGLAEAIMRARLSPAGSGPAKQGGPRTNAPMRA